MWRRLSLKDLGRGSYNPLPDQSDGKDGEPSLPSLGDHDPRPNLMGLKSMLAAFCGFVFAIIMVNLLPGDMVRSGESKLQRPLHGCRFLSRSDWVLTCLVPDETVIFRPIQMFEAPTADSDMAWEALLGRKGSESLRLGSS